MDIINVDTTNSELVLDLVMPYLPIKDCVRTSILSDKWRYRWTTVPRLVFDKRCCSSSRRYSFEEQTRALASIINQVLLLHNGSIEVFQVSDIWFVPDIDRWILHASKNSVKTLVIEIIWGPLVFKLPSSLFSCGSLSGLRLMSCLLMPPPLSFKGFKNLKRLELDSVTLTNDAFEKLISFCPLLEKLTLNDLEEVDNLKINAPNLQSIIIITSEFVKITFEYVVTKLSEIYIDALESEYAYASFLDFFIKLPNLRQVTMKNCYMGFMSGDSIEVESFPFECKDVFHLAICMGFSFVGGENSTLYLCRGSSNLKEEHFKDWNSSYLAIELGVWEDNSNHHHEFKQLRRAWMNKFCGTREELDFLEFMLGNSPVLEEMKVNPKPNSFTVCVQWEQVKSIYEFERASKAKIIIDELVTQIC